MEPIKNQFFQDDHTLQSTNLKSVLTRLPHPSKVETVKNSSFKTIPPAQSGNH